MPFFIFAATLVKSKGGSQMQIGVLGATGFTGKLICQRLAARNIPFSAAARSSEPLKEIAGNCPTLIAQHCLDIYDTDALSKWLGSLDILVNCIGPYNFFGPAVHQAIRRSQNSLIVLDLTGEQAYVKSTLDSPRIAQRFFLHSFAFESCLADLLAARVVLPNVCYDEISSYYHFGGRPLPSPGTRLTMQLARHYPTFSYDGIFKPTAPGELRKRIDLHALGHHWKSASFVPYPEVFFFALSYQVKRSASYFILEDDDGLSSVFGSNRTPAEIIELHQKRKYVGPSEEERRTQQFSLFVETQAENHSQWIGVSGYDMYGISAFIIVSAIERLRLGRQLQPRAGGVVFPHDLFDANTFWTDLSKEFPLDWFNPLPQQK